MKPFSILKILGAICFVTVPVAAQTTGSADNKTGVSQPLSIFGIVPGSTLARADLLAGKYDCIQAPSISRKPKAGSDYCIVTEQRIGLGGTADEVSFAVYFSQPLPVGFQDVYMEIRRSTLEITKVVADTFRNTGDVVFNALVQKYGQPDGNPILHTQNGFGATYDRYHATWLFKDGSALRFDGGSPAIGDGGSILAVGPSADRTNAGRDTTKVNERGL